MATANVYYEILQRVKELDLAHQLRLLEEVSILIRKQATQGSSRSILELQGLGKETWKDVNVKDYIEQERASWDG